MNKSLVVAAALALAVGAAHAQSPNPPAQSGPNNPAVNTTGTNNSNEPVAGANSFTEGQAKSRIEDKRLQQRLRAQEGRQRRLARQGDEGRQVSERQPRFQGNVIAR